MVLGMKWNAFIENRMNLGAIAIVLAETQATNLPKTNSWSKRITILAKNK